MFKYYHRNTLNRITQVVSCKLCQIAGLSKGAVATNMCPIVSLHIAMSILLFTETVRCQS